AAAPTFGADPTVAAAPAGIVIARDTGPERVVTADELAALAAVQVTVAVEPGHGPAQRSYEGPLLWTVLDHAGAIDTAKVRDQVRQTVLITGRDGYTAILALGEIAPEFEGKQVIIAERMDGQPLSPEHLRIVVPGDKRGGRGVRDIVRILVAAAPRAEAR
ncbi:MAG TPA: molybdopterin-dependent oxidoreductase, partial [Acidisphaera sp.]|nr:molybdopterin-dependent oxidoreductase [Acidisphaera sp.]